MTERELETCIRDLARFNGWRIYHTFDSRRSEAGFPDLVLLRPPRLVFAELKSSTGRVTEAQADWLDDLERAGAEVHLWRPADWPERIARVLARKEANA